MNTSPPRTERQAKARGTLSQFAPIVGGDVAYLSKIKRGKSVFGQLPAAFFTDWRMNGKAPDELEIAQCKDRNFSRLRSNLSKKDLRLVHLAGEELGH